MFQVFKRMRVHRKANNDYKMIINNKPRKPLVHEWRTYGLKKV